MSKSEDKDATIENTESLNERDELIKKNAIRQKEESLQKRTEMGEEKLRSTFIAVFEELLEHRNILPSTSHEKSAMDSISNAQINLRNEKAYRILCSAFSKVPYLRRHLSKDVIIDVLIKHGVFKEDGGVTDIHEKCNFVKLFSDFVNILPNHDLTLKEEENKSSGKDQLIETNKSDCKMEENKKKISEFGANKVTDEKEKEKDSKKADDHDDESSKPIKPPTNLSQIIKETTLVSKLFLIILIITTSCDLLKSIRAAGIEEETQNELQLPSNEAVSNIMDRSITLVYPLLMKLTTSTDETHASDVLLARSFYWVMIAKEKLGVLSEELLEDMTQAHRLSGLNRLYLTQATVLNTSLRILILGNRDWLRASHIVTMSQFPTQATRSTAHCRYLLYRAIIICNQDPNTITYAEANTLLKHSMRKAPSGPRGRGIRREIAQMLITTDILLGKTPNKAIFQDIDIANDITAYKDLTKAVHNGNVAEYHRLLTNRRDEFSKHKCFPLIDRHMNQAVVRASLIKIAKTYRRIPIADVQEKIGMSDRPIEETYSIVAKAIADKMLEGTRIDGELECLVSLDRNEKKAASSFVKEIVKKTSEINSIQKELTEALSTPNDDELDDDARLIAAERMRREAEESVLRAQDAYYEDFDF